MSPDHETKDLGEQPLAKLMAEHELDNQDLVIASTEQITHKMVARAIKGRRLTANAMRKIVNAMNECVAPQRYLPSDLFNYRP